MSGDFPERVDERLKNMEQVVLKPHNLPEKLRIAANEISIQEFPSLLGLFNQAYQDDPLPEKY